MELAKLYLCRHVVISQLAVIRLNNKPDIFLIRRDGADECIETRERGLLLLPIPTSESHGGRRR